MDDLIEFLLSHLEPHEREAARAQLEDLSRDELSELLERLRAPRAAPPPSLTLSGRRVSAA